MTKKSNIVSVFGKNTLGRASFTAASKSWKCLDSMEPPAAQTNEKAKVKVTLRIFSS